MRSIRFPTAAIGPRLPEYINSPSTYHVQVTNRTTNPNKPMSFCQSKDAMAHLDTHASQTVTIKPRPKSANLCKFCLLVAFASFSAAIYFIFKKPIESLGDPSDQFSIKNIPKVYSSVDEIDPEEREVFHGFRTSFIPAEEIVLARRNLQDGQDVCEGNVTSDTFIFGTPSKQDATPTRVKRMSRYRLSSQTNDRHDSQDHSKDDASEAREDYEADDNDYENDEDIESIVRPEMHVDRGPLDDVVEQIRGQPELEEGEMISSVQIYKPSNSYTGINSFWKDQGDKRTIRDKQAQIMKQYMDADADPCHDFYQYACGNWASLNPIPADKAGYDTFEMLRENLDSVLKDLLEFKSHEKIPCVYPGPHLVLEENLLEKECPYCFNSSDIDFFHSKETFSTSDQNGNYTKIVSDRKQIENRIRRYLDRKLKPFSKIKNKLQNYMIDNNRRKKEKQKRNTYHTEDIDKKGARRRFIMESDSAPVGRRLMMFRNKIQNIKEYKPADSFFTYVSVSTTSRSGNGIIHPMKTKEEKPKIEDLAKGDAALKARFLFKSCMNYKILEKRGHQPLLDLLHALGGWPILDPSWNNTNFDWLDLMGKLRLYNNDILISEWVGPDIKNSDEFVIQFDQTSLGLPTRDYFLQDSNKLYLEAYKTYLKTIAKILGGEPKHVERSAEQMIAFEINLAKITSAPEDRRNVSELYRRMPLKKLEQLVPHVDWRRYLCMVMNRKVKSDETVVLFALSYVRHLVQLIKQTDSRILANYLLWRFVRHRVNNLDDRFQLAKQQFYFILFGREQAPPRWKNCVSQVNSNMGMALGSMFVRKYFDEMSKNDTLTMTREIQQSFRELLAMTNWIDNKTKKLAAHKVDAMMLRIGYPDFILNKKELDERYKEVKIHPDKYFENILNILQHLTKMEQARIGQPVNKTLWNTAPAVVNAYYSRNKNQIMFPAGILQPPFYHRHFPRSLNYGGIGVVIGHEITHGFDDKGRLFDCDGNLHRWWSDSAIEAFHRRAQCLIDQYGQYVVPEVNMKLDGVNTQGENIADNGGVKQAFRAYLHWVQKHGAADETLPGLNHTHTQLFFLNFAQVWCGAMRPEAMRNKLKTAVHSPGRFRVIGTLSNSHDFAREFRCKPGSPMNPKYKCTVW